VCKGPTADEPVATKDKCPVPDCEEMLHPAAIIRHIQRIHPEVDVDIYRSKSAHSSNPQERRANLAKFRAVKEVKIYLILLQNLCCE